MRRTSGSTLSKATEHDRCRKCTDSDWFASHIDAVMGLLRGRRVV